MKAMKLNTNLLIGLVGRRFSGKTAAQKMLWEHFGYTPINFADPLKALCSEAFGLTDEQLNGGQKEQSLGALANMSPRWFMQQVGTEVGRQGDYSKIDEASPELGKRLREVFERRFGSTGEGEANPNRWVYALRDRVHAPSHMQPRSFVVGDVRFPDEAAWLKEQGGVLWRIVRPAIRARQLAHESGHSADQHASEIFADELEVDAEIVNDSTISEFHHRVRMTHAVYLVEWACNRRRE